MAGGSPLTAERLIMRRDAARRRRRKHADPLRGVRPTAIRSRSTGGLRPSANRPVTSSARRCRTCSGCAAWLRGDRRLDRLLDRAPAVRAVDSDGRALPRPRDARGRPDDPHRDADPDRQPPRGRCRPARERGRGVRPGPRHVRRRRLRHRDHLRRRVGRRRVPRRDHQPRRRDLDRRALRARGEAAQGRARRAAIADRQVDGRRDPKRDRVRLRRPGRGDRPPAARRAGATTTGDRDRRTGAGAGAVRARDDRRGR